MPVRWKPMIARTAFMVIAIFVYFSVMPMMPIAEARRFVYLTNFVLLFHPYFSKSVSGGGGLWQSRSVRWVYC